MKLKPLPLPSPPPSGLSTPLSMPEKFRTSLRIIARISFSDACAMNETLNYSFFIDTTYPWVPEGFFSKARERHSSRGQSGALRFAWRSFGPRKKIPLVPRVYNTHSNPMVFDGSFSASRNVYCSERERFRRGSNMNSLFEKSVQSKCQCCQCARIKEKIT